MNAAERLTANAGTAGIDARFANPGPAFDRTGAGVTSQPAQEDNA